MLTSESCDEARKPILHRASLVACLILAALLLPPRASAELMAPDRDLFIIATERFEFYYPAELRLEAARLAAEADGIFDELASVFPRGAASLRRLPVLLTDQAASPGGGYGSFPSNRIILWTGAPSLGDELGSFEDSLLSAFAHELAHAMSMSTRGPFWAFWSKVLGDYVQSARWMAPASLLEGTAIAFEGLGGPGRAQDPFALTIPRQDIVENRFKDYWQAGGAWDDYPFGALPYAYGGPFVARLVEMGGYESLGRLWETIGEGRLGGLEGSLLESGDFARIYGLPFDRLWEDFRRSAALGEGVLTAVRPLTSEPGYVTALAAGERDIYWADAARGAVLAHDRATGKTVRLFDADSRIGRLDLSADGKRLLVSWTRLEGSVELPILRTWDIPKGAFVGNDLRGLYDGAWAGEAGAIVALESRGSGTDLVLVDGGNKEILLEGGPERVYGQPASRDGRIAYLLAKDSGRTELLRYDRATREARALAPGIPLEHLRHLALARTGRGPDGPTDGSEPVRLAVTFAAETPAGPGLYRAALVEDGPDGARLARQELSLSGSVLWPAMAPDAAVFYVALFSEGMFVCRFPDDGAVPMRDAEASWTLLDPSYSTPTSATPRPQGAAARKASALPLLFRTFRLPYVSDDLDSAGLVIGGRDLSERLAWNAGAAYAWGPGAVDASLALELQAAPWTVRTALSDDFAQAASGGYYRMAGAALALEREWRFLPQRRAFALELDLAAGGAAAVEPGAAYSSPFAETRYGLRSIARFGDERREPYPPRRKRGYSAFLAADFEGAYVGGGIAGLRPPASGIQAGLDAAFPLAGTELLLRASASPSGGIGFGPRGRTMETGAAGSILEPLSPYFSEFEGLASPYARLYGFGQISLLLLSAELQKRARIGGMGLPLYFQRFQARLGYRAATLAESVSPEDARFLASTFLRAEFSASPLIGGSSRERYSVGLEAAYALTPGYSGQEAKISLIFDSGL